MKRLGVFVLMIAVLLTLTACKRQAVKDVETARGTVNVLAFPVFCSVIERR